MPLHETEKVRAELDDDVYAAPDLSVAMPQFRIPKYEHASAEAYAAVHDELMLDGNSRMNLATFCQTWVEPEVHRLMNEALDKNLVDKDEYPQTAAIEARCVNMLADLWHAPDAAKTIGCSTTGSSEAAMLGGLAMKWRWRKRRESAGKPTDKPNLISGPVQVCWHKFARYFDVELREVPLEKGRLELTPEEVLKHCDENTIGVVPTLGLTFTLRYEPVAAIAKALDELEKRTGLDVPIHVDGASGGFIAPFLHPEVEWDFSLPRSSRSTPRATSSAMTPLGCGFCVWRERERAAGGPDLLRRLPGRQHADLRAQLLAPRRAGHRPVLQLPPPREGGLPARSPRLLRHGSLPREGDRRRWDRSRCSTTAAVASPARAGHSSTTARLRASRSTISLIV